MVDGETRIDLPTEYCKTIMCGKHWRSRNNVISKSRNHPDKVVSSIDRAQHCPLRRFGLSKKSLLRLFQHILYDNT